MSTHVLGKAWLSGLLVLGLVAGLLGVAPPESARGEHGDVEDIDFAASYSACVGAATESAGFEDTEGINAEEAIDCLFHYGITTGRSETRYAPGETVLRWQMALFLARAASAAGIALANPAPEEGFTDIGAVSEEAQNAINGLAAAGIMPGTSTTSFSPNASVNRGSMAMLLDAFLRESTPGAGAFGGEIEVYSDVKADNFNVFTDVNNVSLTTYNAIYRIYELGVTKGIGDHQFNPSGLVTRGQMASFITRAFAHTIARPAGVSVQAEKDQVLGSSGVQLIVSVRDMNFQPIADASVDVFRSTDPDNAFQSDGDCDAGAVARVGGVGRAVCQVDAGDETTDAAGDITALELQVTDADVTVWAWTGDPAEQFDSDDTAAATLTVGFSKAASQVLVSDNLVEGQTSLQFGETATLIIQVTDEDGQPVAEEDVRVTVAQVTTPDVTKATQTTSSTSTYTTDAAGKFELSFTQNDPSSGEDPDATVTVTLSNPSSYNLQDEDGEAFTTHTFRWSDDQGTPAQLVLETRQDYVEASEEGRGATATVVATLTDQFGSPIRGQRILFWSDNPLGVGEEAEDALLDEVRATLAPVAPRGDSESQSDFNARLTAFNTGVRNLFDYSILGDVRGKARFWRTTNRSGQAILSYNRDAVTAVVETVRARLVQGQDDALRPDGENSGLRWGRTAVTSLPASASNISTYDDDLLSERAAVYWATELEDEEAAAGRILFKDPAQRRVVFADDEGRVRIADFDANDQFRLGGVPSVFSEFEKFLRDEAAHIDVGSYEETASGVSRINLDAEWPSVDLSGIPSPNPFWDELEPVNIHYASDGGTIVVSSHWHDNLAGAVWVFDGVDDATPQKLTAPTPQPYTGTHRRPWRDDQLITAGTGGWFGWAVDIRGDTLAIGEPGRLDSRTGFTDKPNGAVYIFTRGSNGVWALDATLTTTNTSSGLTAWPEDRGMLLGRAVAVSKDETTVAASAPNFYDSANRISGVYLFTRPDQASRTAGDKWDDQDGSASPRLQMSPAVSNANYGRWHRLAYDRELAISEDGSTVVAGLGEGNFNRVVNGIRYELAGGAFVFTKPSAGWSTSANTHQDAVFYSPAPFTFEKLGRSVAVSANGDTIVVSDNYRPNTMRQGRALVFERPDQAGRSDGDMWEDEPEPTAILEGPEHPDAPANCPAAGTFRTCNLGDTFGQWVDITDDGGKIVASRSTRAEDYQRGSIHVFTKPAAGWASTEVSVELQGSKPKSGFGWRTHFDQATGDIMAVEADPVVLFQIAQ